MTRGQSAPSFCDVELREPGPGEVLVRIGGAGVFHSDLHVLDYPEGALPYALPFTLGHENAGWVERVGAGVSGWAEGAPVMVYSVWGCGRCAACRWAWKLLRDAPAFVAAASGSTAAWPRT
jgi:propanol-preferring alcohol dehydrogenase